MPDLRLAMAQINPTVGDLAGNSRQILEKVQQAQNLGSNLVLFPELALTGYPIEDLALSKDFLNDSGKALEALAMELVKRGQGHWGDMKGKIRVADDFCEPIEDMKEYMG